VSEPRSEAKQRVLERLKWSGPSSAARLAHDLRLTGAAVRQHLAGLRDEGMVEPVPGTASGPGRPAAAWRLTALAADAVPDRHGELTVELLAAIRSAVGEEALDAVISARTEHQLAVYREALDGVDGSGERVAVLAGRRSAEGYMAEVRDTPEGGWLLVEHHCPIGRAARQCIGLCQAELALFRDALGEEVTVDRVEHALSGDDRCTYRVRPRAR
jgi:predicted ArsR family transcriptional regulator